MSFLQEIPGVSERFSREAEGKRPFLGGVVFFSGFKTSPCQATFAISPSGGFSKWGEHPVAFLFEGKPHFLGNRRQGAQGNQSKPKPKAINQSKPNEARSNMKQPGPGRALAPPSAHLFVAPCPDAPHPARCGWNPR